MAIYFYRQDEQPYGCFSNFFAGCPVNLDGLEWPTVEHYFQAQKFPGHPEIQEEIRRADWAGLTKRIVRKHSDLVDWSWWDGVRGAVMMKALRAKFSQHERLRDILLSTGDEELVEHTVNDRYWADGGDGSGMNMLGKMLMKVRTELSD